MLPHFICIGAQKSGTTWLYQNLKDHPQIWLPPLKELRYFRIEEQYPWLFYLFNNHPRRRRLLAIMRKKAFPDAMRLKNIRWYLRYLCLPRSDNWYAALFLPKTGQIAGDICPSFARLDESRVADIYALMPNLKIIYLLRNPINRLWSQTVMHYTRRLHQSLHTISDEQIKTFLHAPHPPEHGQYLRVLQIWEQFYPKEQIFIGFFEQLVQNPGKLLADIYQFLEVNSSEQYIPDAVHQKVYPGQYSLLPARWARYLAQQHHQEIERLHERFNNSSTASWLAFANSM
jgi:hypothetical protein